MIKNRKYFQFKSSSTKRSHSQNRFINFHYFHKIYTDTKTYLRAIVQIYTRVQYFVSMTKRLAHEAVSIATESFCKEYMMCTIHICINSAIIDITECICK